MGGGRAAESFKVVTALQRGHNLASASPTRDFEHSPRRPGEILGLQALVSERIAPVRIDAGRDQDQGRRERIECRHQTARERPPP